MKTNVTLSRNFITVAIIALLLASCASAASNEVSSTFVGGQAESMPAAEAPMALPAADAAMAEAPLAEKSAAVGSPAANRIVIVNVDMSIVVDDPIAKMDEISKMAEGMGGYVVSSNVYKTATPQNVMVPQGSINVRVPADKLDAALAQIKAGVVSVDTENRNGQDVTDQYVDLQSQLKAKQAAESKLYQIMENSTTAEDTLAVFNQLMQVQSDIEVLKGQINYYDQASSLSSINIMLIANESVQPIEIGGWKPAGVAKDAVESLIKFFQGLVDFLIWLIIFIIPVLLIGILILWVLWKITSGFWKRLFKGKKTAESEEGKHIA